MNISSINIHSLLPQQPPFVMVDRLMHCDTLVTKTQFLVRNDNLFIKNGFLLESGIVENIAQTCAARMGYINSIINDNEVKLGFIGAIKNLNIHKSLKVGDLLETQIEVQNEVFNMILVNAKVLVGTDLIAECEMKISEQ